MDITRPGKAILGAGMQAVLEVLDGTTRPLTGREIARLAELSHNGAHQILRTLSDHGIIEAETAGRAILYRLDREHVLVGPLVDLLHARERAVDLIAEAISDWGIAPAHASLFGSVARGDGNTTSDVDVLVIRVDGLDPDDSQWRAQLDAVGRQGYAWTGNRLAWFELSWSELRSAVDRDEPIVEEWRRDARWLAGSSTQHALARNGNAA